MSIRSVNPHDRLPSWIQGAHSSKSVERKRRRAASTRTSRRIAVFEPLETRQLLANDLSALSPFIRTIFEPSGQLANELASDVGWAAPQVGDDQFNSPPLAGISGAKGPAQISPFQFADSNRWNITTSNSGGGLIQGDPTTLTWSIVPDGTSVVGGAGEASSSSSLISFLGTIYGVATNDSNLTDEPWFPLFESYLNRWAALSGLSYVYEPNDDGLVIDGIGAGGQSGVRGDLRISGHTIDGPSGILAYNYYPIQGDMVIDTADTSFFGNTANTSRALRNVLAHENGHGVGLSHVCPVIGGLDGRLMEPFVNLSIDGPQFDDILAIQRGYGDALEKSGGNDSRATATDLGSLADGQTITRGADSVDNRVAPSETGFVSIDDDSDRDFFKFTTTAVLAVDLTLTPRGPTYLSGPQNANGTCSAGTSFNASNQSDLTIELIDTNGTVLRSANANGLGGIESITNVALAPGTYFAKITGANNAAQMYELNAHAVATSATILHAAGLTITSESIQPGNLVLDPSETATVNFSLANVGNVSSTNLVATLMATGGVVSPSGPQSYGVVTPGSSVARSFTFGVSDGITCGTNVTATLQLQDGATDLGTVPFTFQCGVSKGNATANLSTGSISTLIPDLDTLEIPLVVSGSGLVTDVDVKIRLDHTFDDDLGIYLVHPDGTTVELSSQNGGGNDNYGSGANDCSGTPTIFDDSATTAITAGTAPFAGTFRPETSLSVLNGKSVTGTWKLRISDFAGGDEGTVGCFQLVISGETYACSRVWDGGGATNNWSESANWSSAPQAGDRLIFNGTSTKNSTVDASSTGILDQLVINPGYTGTITLQRSLSTGSLSGNAGNIALGSNTLTTGGDNNHTTYGGALSGAGGLTKTGTGSYYLRGNSSYDGTTTINDGSILVSTNNALGTATGSTIVAGGANARLVFERSVNYTTPEPVTINGAGFGSNGSLMGVGNSTFAGPVTLASASTIGASPAGYTFTLNGPINNNGNNLTFRTTGNTTAGGVISGSGGLIKEGIGTLTLANANTYSGSTAVNNGTVLVNGSNSSSAVTVNSNAILGGVGTIGAATISGGTLSPGANSSTGILSGSSANFSSSGILRVQIQGYATPGSSFDRLNLSGHLTTGGDSKLVLDLAGLSTTGTATGIVVSGSQSGTFFTVEKINNPNNYFACLSYSGTSVNVTIQLGACGQFVTASDLSGASGSLDAQLASTRTLAANSRAVTVANLDSGVDYSHPALYQNIWINTREIPSAVLMRLRDSDRDGRITLRDLNYRENQGNGRITDLNLNGLIDGGDLLLAWSDRQDSDRNGYVDDLIGWDFVNGDNNPMDDNGHGTHAAGVIVQVAPRAEILPLKFLDANIGGSLSAARQALDYALAQGVSISSNGWSASTVSQEWIDVVRRAEAAGHLFVTAAGNGDPALLAMLKELHFGNVLTVGAVDVNGRLAAFSNWDPGVVDLVAPGVGVISALPGGQAAPRSGTSVSTAFVAGYAALLKGTQPQTSLDRTKVIDSFWSQFGQALNLDTALRDDELGPALAVAAEAYYSSVKNSSSSWKEDDQSPRTPTYRLQ